MGFNDVSADKSRTHIYLHVMVHCDIVLVAIGFPVVSRTHFSMILRRGVIFAVCISSPTQLRHASCISTCVARRQPPH